MTKEVEKFPEFCGLLAADLDNMEEAVSGVKGELA